MEEVDEFKALGSMEAELECRVHAELERYTMQLENVRQEHDKPKDDYTFRAPRLAQSEQMIYRRRN